MAQSWRSQCLADTQHEHMTVRQEECDRQTHAQTPVPHVQQRSLEGPDEHGEKQPHQQAGVRKAWMAEEEKVSTIHEQSGHG